MTLPCLSVFDGPCYQNHAFAVAISHQTLSKTGWKGKQEKQKMGYILDVFLTSQRFKVTQIQRRFFHLILPESAHFPLIILGAGHLHIPNPELDY